MENRNELKLINMNDVAVEEIKWVWYPYIPYGKMTIIQGDPGEGKTTFALALVALLTKGEPLPEEEKRQRAYPCHLPNGRGRLGRYHQTKTTRSKC